MNPSPAARSASARPNLLIAGVKKAGTTSLFDYLGRHPEVFAPPAKTTNYLTPLRLGSDQLPPLSVYESPYRKADREAYRLEAASSYVYGGRAVASRAAELMGEDSRVIVSLRDPVRRLWSDFNMKRRERTLPTGIRTFEQYVELSHDAYLDSSFHSRPGLTGFARGVYADPLSDWLGVFDSRIRVVFFEHWSHDVTSALVAMFEWMGLDPSPALAIPDAAHNSNRDYRSRLMADLARRAYRVAVRRTPMASRLKPALLALHDQANRRPARDRLDARLLRQVEELYLPHNLRLARLFEEHGIRDLPSWVPSLVTGATS